MTDSERLILMGIALLIALIKKNGKVDSELVIALTQWTVEVDRLNEK